MRFRVYILGILLIASAQQAIAQAQIDTSSEKKQTPAHVDSAVDHDELAHQDSDAKTVNDKWLKSRADDLKDVLSCYFPSAALDKLVAKQEEDADNDADLIKTRIKQLKDLAKHHAEAKYCR
jgi:hypothetical protein